MEPIMNDPGNMITSEIEAERRLKDQKFRTSPNSPLTPLQLQTFTGLYYYAVDLKYSLTARFNASAPGTLVELTLTNGQKQKFTEYGILSFTLDGTAFQLSVFENQNLPELSDDPSLLFIPFIDFTMLLVETYPYGRYITIRPPAPGAGVALDFNRAFNPYSAYNPAYNGVVPPAANVMRTNVKGGERKYEDR